MSIFDDLESINGQKVEDFKLQLRDQFNATKEPWLLNGIYDYYLNTNSLRAVEVLVMVKEPHDKYYFDRALDGVRGPNRLQNLTLLGHVVRKKPIWLYKIFQHHLLGELFRILKGETDIVVIVSALLILNILIPSIPGKVGPYLDEIFSVFSKLAAMNANSNNYQDVQLVHLQISLYTLFHRLYGMFPCNFINFLRKEYSTTDTRPVFAHTVKPMLDTVRVNPLLITAGEVWEKAQSRWMNVETHDIIVSCAKLLTNGGGSSREYHQNNMYEPKSPFNCKDLLDVVKVTNKQTVSDYCKQLSKSATDTSLWSPSVRFHEKRHVESTPTKILTPIVRGFEVSSPYSEHEGSSPPEAAIEATPETTPIQECIAAPPALLLMTANRSLPFVKDNAIHGTKVPIPDRSFPNSPVKKESSPFRYSAPEIVPMPLQASRKVNVLLTDRKQLANENCIVELRPIGVQTRNDLIGNHERTHPVISTVNAPSFVDGVSDEKSNGSRPPTDVPMAEAVDDFDPCVLEKSGSPCSSGGLHMPDNQSLCNFALQMKRMRSRHYSQCNSDSERFSPGNSPRDGGSYFPNSKVRRTNSCPEMKKSSPNSTNSSDSPSKEVFEEKDEDGIEKFTAERETFQDKLKKHSKKTTSATQTDDVPSFPYEHLFLDVFPPLHPARYSDQISPTESENSIGERCSSVYEKAHSPSKLLQRYIDAAVQCHNDKRDIVGKTPTLLAENKYLTNQLRLMGAQLQLEEYKREVHAERNRRLLGRSRRNKTLEEHNNALRDQVVLLQQEIENCNEEVMKIIKEKEVRMNREHETAMYWQKKFAELQQEHKMVANRCQKVEAQLKEEKDSNEQNQKLLRDNRATLTDITNNLRSFQSEAMEARNLRNMVAELQVEVLKAGELIINYKNNLMEASFPIDNKAQQEYIQQAYFKEVKTLKQIINAQQCSLQASKELIASLKGDLENKENYISDFTERLKKAKEIQQNDIKDLQKRLAEMKILYDRELARSNDLGSQLNRAKRVTKFSSASMPPRNIDYSAKLSAIFDSEEGGNGLRSAQNVPKSPLRSYFTPTDEQQIELSKKVCPEDLLWETERVKNSAKVDPSKNEELPQLGVKSEKIATKPPEAVEIARDPDTVGVDMFKSIVKKKSRMECAESGQLRPLSFTLLDPEPTSSKSE